MTISTDFNVLAFRPETQAPDATTVDVPESADQHLARSLWAPATGRATALTRDADQLARNLRRSERFTATVEHWLGFDLRRKPRGQDRQHILSAHEALVLDADTGDEAVHRDGWLVPRRLAAGFNAAAISAVILPGAVDPDADPTDTLGVLLADAIRAVYFVRRLRTEPKAGNPVLHSRAVLYSSTGNPVALVRETVDWQTILHHHRPQ